MGHGMNSVTRRCLRHRLPPRKRPRDSSTTSTRSPRPRRRNRSWPSPSTLCQTAQGKEYRREAIERRAGVQKAAERRQQVQAAEETLQKDPDDGPANLLLGRWYCTAEKDWTRGIRSLAKAADAELQAVARRDTASSPRDAEQQAKLGDTWWDLAQSRAGEDRGLCLSRAGFWYQKAVNGMPAGLLRMRTEKRLADIRSEHSPP